MFALYFDHDIDQEQTPVVLYNVECEGNEPNILECSRSEVPSFDDKDYQIVGVICIPL